MRRIVGLVSSLVLSLACVTVSWADLPSEKGEYAYVVPKVGSNTYQQYLNELDAPYVHITTQCPKNNGKCWPVIKNRGGETLKSFSSSTSVSRLAIGRYKDKAYLYYSASYKRGDKTVTESYVIDHKGNNKTKNSAYELDSLDRIVTSEGEVLTITPAGLVVDGKAVISTFSPLKYASFGSDPNGKLAMIGIDGGGFVHVSDMDSWIETGEKLESRGDRNGVLSVYPATDMLYFSVYKYVNSYNKGLVFGRVNTATKEAERGWLFNSELANVGFDPSVYERDANVIVSAKNSTEDGDVHFVIPHDYDVPLLADNHPEHIKGFEEQRSLELMLGTGLSALNWMANADVEKDGTTYAQTNYDIANSLYKSYWIQGKYDNTQLAITYTQNEAEKVGGQTKQVSNFLNAVVDFNGLFSPQYSLRLKLEQGSVGGVAKLSANPASGATLLSSAGSVEFETKLEQYSALVMGERGNYAGLMYESYQMPGMLGFSDNSKSIKYVGYDPKTQLTKLAFVFGYDELDYVRRYENNISRFYTDWMFDIGFVGVDVSSELKNKLAANGKKLTSSSAFGLDGKLDFGYIHQQKIKKWSGAGYAASAGYRVKGSYMGSGQSEDSKAKLEADKVALEFSRWDVWHGLYATISLVY